MTDNCKSGCCHGNAICRQNLDELEFERGIWQGALDGDTSRIKHFVSKGIDIDIKDSSGYTALHYASRNGHVESVKYILSQGACVNCVTKSGKDTPLHRAAFVGNYEVVDLLLQHNAIYDCQNADGQTCLHKAVQGGHKDIVRLLLTYDGLKGIKDNKGKVASEYSKEDEVSNTFRST